MHGQRAEVAEAERNGFDILRLLRGDLDQAVAPGGVTGPDRGRVVTRRSSREADAPIIAWLGAGAFGDLHSRVANRSGRSDTGSRHGNREDEPANRVCRGGRAPIWSA